MGISIAGSPTQHNGAVVSLPMTEPRTSRPANSGMLSWSIPHNGVCVVQPPSAPFNIRRLTQLNSPAFYIWPWFRRHFSRSPTTFGSPQNAGTAVW